MCVLVLEESGTEPGQLGLGLPFWNYRVFPNPWFQLQSRKQSKCTRPFPGGNETLSASSWVKNQGGVNRSAGGSLK